MEVSATPRNRALLIAFICLGTFVQFVSPVPKNLRAQQPEPVPGGMPGDEGFSKVSARISSVVEQGNVPSVSIAVARKGRIIWERSFGWADRASRRLTISDGIVHSTP